MHRRPKRAVLKHVRTTKELHHAAVTERAISEMLAVHLYNAASGEGHAFYQHQSNFVAKVILHIGLPTIEAIKTRTYCQGIITKLEEPLAKYPGGQISAPVVLIFLNTYGLSSEAIRL